MKYKNSAKLIKSIREKAGLSQLEFAKLLGFDNAQFVSNIERGVASLPAKRINKIKSLVNKDLLLSAYLADVKSTWLDEAK